MERANPSSSRTMLFPSGSRVASRYTVESVIGEGMSGVVYRARRDDDGELVALKVIHRDLCADDQMFKRFQREAQILKRIEGQHVVKLYDFVEEDGLVIIVLEYVDATSLEAMIHETPPTMDQAVEITLQVCAALGAAHAAGVVHRDLKPANVLIERFTNKTGLCVRVVDFGLAKVVRGDPQGASLALTERDMIFGTPEYMAPEQVRGDDVDLRADIYAAGVMLYEMVVGQIPFSRRTPLETMDAHLTAELPRPRASREGAVVPPALVAVILRALSKEPGERYPSARAFAEALTAAWSERLVIAPHAVEDPDTMATNDTELNVSASASARGLASMPPHLSSTSLDPITVSSPNALARSGGAGAAAAGRLFWIIAAFVALICMIIGVWIGIR